MTIELRALTAVYPGHRESAVDGLTCRFEAGAITGLLGPNGAGKTTTVHAITTVIPISSGDALVLGRSARTEPQAVRRLIGLMSQLDTVDWSLTVGQQIEFAARLAGLSGEQRRLRIEELTGRFGLRPVLGRDPVQVSGGQLKRLQLVCALLRQPPVLFVDEPTLGLDPLGVDAVLAELRTLARGGTTVVLATNELEQVAAVCDRAVFLRQGRLAAQGTPAALAAAHGGDLRQAFRALAGGGAQHGDGALGS